MDYSKICVAGCVALPIAVAMEFWAMFLHGKIWHSWLWPIHKSHHRPLIRSSGEEVSGRRYVPSGWEFNDVFSIVHAVPSVVAIVWGLQCWSSARCGGYAGPLSFGFGLGLALFGIAYFVVHDGLVHRRLPVQFLLRSAYFKRVYEAHMLHHKVHGGPYGLFLGHWEVRRNRK